MKLLILTPEYRGSGGGIITHYQALIPALRDLGIQIHVIEGSGMHAVHDPDIRSETGVRTEILAYHRLARWHERLAAYSATPGLRRHLAAAWAMWEQAGYGKEYDVVEACDFGLLFVPPVVDRKRPLIVQCHGSIGQIAVHDPLHESETESLLVRLIERSVLQYAQSIRTYSSANARFWEDETRRPVISASPPLAVSTSPPDCEISSRGLVVGRLQRWKGPHVLCEALKSLGSSAPSVDWIGRDTLWDSTELKSADFIAAEYPQIWGRTFHHIPPIDRQEVGKRQAGALFNIVPSTWDVYNFTVAEAMASGRPTIVSTGAGASDLVESGRNGFLFENGDSQALAALIKDVVGSSPERLRQIGNAGRETVARELDPAAVGRTRIATYQEAIDTFQSTVVAAPVSEWLTSICRPEKSNLAGEFTFLSQFPLRALVAHVARRLGTRIRG